MNDFIKKQVTEKINKIFPQVVAFRRDLHEHPELSGQEERTSRRIAEELEKLGVSYRVTPEKAVVGTVPGKGPAPSGKYTGLGIRADFDALPITEESGVAWASQNPGVMHACGHDMHTAMLLGTAMVLQSMPEAFGGNVKLLFQPNEEAEGGAENMIKAGCMEDPAVDAVIAFHIEPGIPSGYIQLCPGKMNAATCDVHITVEGVACHGAHPDRGIDAILAASQIVTALQAVVARNLAPTQPGVVTIGQFHAGNASNVVAGTAELSGTLRALDCLEKEGSGEISQRQLEEVCHSAHPTMTEILKKLEKKGFIETQPSETDHRRKAIRQTDRARELRLAMSRVDEETFEKFCTGMSEEQTKSLGEMLDRLMKNACSCAKEEERE